MTDQAKSLLVSGQQGGGGQTTTTTTTLGVGGGGPPTSRRAGGDGQVAYQRFADRESTESSCASLDSSSSAETCLSCAEAAAAHGLWDLARKALAAQESASASGQGRSLRDNKDVVACRVACARAQMSAEAARGTYEGEKRTAAIADALNVLAQSLEAVKKAPRCSYLVYNASLVWWRIARQLSGEGTRGSLAPSLRLVVKALEESNDTLYAWRARFSLLLAKCLEESKLPEAVGAAQSAFQLACKNKEVALSTAALRAESLRMLTHANKGSQEALSRLKTDMMGPSFKDLRTHFLLQLVSSGSTKDQKELKEAVTQATLAKSDELLGQVAVVAAQLSATPVAVECLQKLEQTKHAKARVLASLAGVEIDLRQLLARRELAHPRSSTCVGPMDPDAKLLLALVERLSFPMDTTLRGHANTPLADSEFPHWGQLAQDAVLLSWRALVPLLQHHRTNPSVKKAMSRCLQSLEAVSSTDASLLCRLHRELALCDVSEGQLSGASSHVDAAIASSDSAALIDDELRPWRNRLAFQTNLYADSASLSPLDRAYQALAKTKDLLRGGKSSQANRDLAKELLKSATGLLEASPACFDRMTLLRDVVVEASGQSGFLEVVRRAHGLWFKEDGCAGELLASQEGLRHTAEVLYALGTSLVNCSPAPQRLADGFTESQLSGLRQHVLGIKTAVRAQEALLVTNGAVQIWNTCLPWISCSLWEPPKEFLVECFKALEEMGSESADVCVAGPICSALLRCLLEVGSRGRAVDHRCRDLRKDVSDSDLVLAEGTVRFALGLSQLSPAHRKEVASMLVRLATVKGGVAPSSLVPAKTLDDKTQLSCSVEGISAEPAEPKRRELLHKALMTASSLVNYQPDDVDIFGKLAVSAIELKEYDSAMKMATQGTGLVTVSSDVDTPQNQLRWLAVCKYVSAKAFLRDMAVSQGMPLTGVTAPALFRSTWAAAESVMLAARAGEARLVEVSARTFWNSCLPLSQLAVTKRLLAEPLPMVTRVCARQEQKDFNRELLAQLFLMSLECLRETGQVEEGLDLTEEAFHCLSSEYYADIWRSKAVFLSGSTHVSPEMLGVHDKDSRTQAQLFTSLAALSKSPEDQMMWYQRAMKCIEPLPLEYAQCVAQYVSWIVSQGRDLSQVDDLLKDAISKLRTHFEKPQPPPQQQQPQQQATTHAQPSSNAGSAAASPHLTPKRAAGPEHVSVVATARNRTPSTGRSSRTSSTSRSKAPVIFKVEESAELSPDLVGPKDRVEIARYWALLCRLYVLRFLVPPTISSVERTRVLSFSLSCVAHCWRAILSPVGLPATVEDWLKLDVGSVGMPCDEIFGSWTDLAWMCRQLLQHLQDRGAHQLCMPLFSLVDLALCSTKSGLSPVLAEALRKANQLEQFHLLVQLGRKPAFRPESFLPSPQALQAVRQEAKQHEALRDVSDAARELSSSLSRACLHLSTESSRAAKRVAIAPSNAITSRAASASNSPALEQARALVGGFAPELTVEGEWARTAALLVEDGSYVAAKTILSEVLERSRLLDNHKVVAFACHQLARIAAFEHFESHAMWLEREALSRDHRDPWLLVEAADRVSSILRRKGSRAVTVSAPLLDALRSLQTSLSGSSLSVGCWYAVRLLGLCVARVQLLLARLSVSDRDLDGTSLADSATRVSLDHAEDCTLEASRTVLETSRFVSDLSSRRQILSSLCELLCRKVSELSPHDLRRVLASVFAELSRADQERHAELVRQSLRDQDLNVVERYLKQAETVPDVPVITL